MKSFKLKNAGTGAKNKVSGDMSTLSFVTMSNDYIKFILRLLSFYSYNFKQTSLESHTRLEKLIYKIIPSCKTLLKILKQKRKIRKLNSSDRQRYQDTEFPYDDENIIYIVILKILESYHSEFSKSTDLH